MSVLEANVLNAFALGDSAGWHYCGEGYEEGSSTKVTLTGTREPVAWGEP